MRLAINLIYISAAAIAIGCINGSTSFAQSSKRTARVELYSALPPPLEDVDGNMLDFEKNGHLTIEQMKFRKVGRYNKSAMVWTLKANKPLTYQYVNMILRDFRDVRFYLERPENKNKGLRALTREVHFTTLDYDQYIKDGAANGRMLARDDTFDIWIYMDKLDVNRLKFERTNRVVFSESGREEELRKRRFSKERAYSKFSRN